MVSLYIDGKKIEIKDDSIESGYIHIASERKVCKGDILIIGDDSIGRVTSDFYGVVHESRFADEKVIEVFEEFEMKLCNREWDYENSEYIFYVEKDYRGTIYKFTDKLMHSNKLFKIEVKNVTV